MTFLPSVTVMVTVPVAGQLTPGGGVSAPDSDSLRPFAVLTASETLAGAGALISAAIEGGAGVAVGAGAAIASGVGVAVAVAVGIGVAVRSGAGVLTVRS